MWIPVVSDATRPGLRREEEARIEAILELVPETVLETVNFLWIRDYPSVDEFTALCVSFRSDAPPAKRLAAAVYDPDPQIVLELYAGNIAEGLADPWLADNWGICSSGLRMTLVEKTEIVIFALLLSLAIRKGLIDDAKILVRLIGRVVFRAAVRRAINKLLEDSTISRASLQQDTNEATSRSDRQPITDEEMARTDMDALFRQLLGLDANQDESGANGAAQDAG